jgi:murein DD-endopeptidase MepM/ murein hydrolase activator NlpD
LALALVPSLAGLISGGVSAARAQAPPSQAVSQQSPPTTTFLDQLLGALFPTTTTTAPPAAGSTPPPGGGAPDSGPSSGPPPPAANDARSPDDRTVPPEAQSIINSVLRTGSNNNLELLAALHRLTDQGLTEEEAAVVGMGQFPVAGEAYWSDDWLMPRFTPTFHLHQGCDVFAARGTPARAPSDGSVAYASEGAGGLAAYVTAADGTYYYMAHLDSFATDLHSGSRVKQGEVVGFVGSTGNADGGSPHLHFEVHPGGGAAVNSKPFLDRWLADAIANVPEVLGPYQVGLPRPFTSAGMLRRLDVGSLGGPASTDGPQLWANSVRRDKSGVRLTSVESGSDDPAPWDPRARGAQARANDVLRAEQMARDVLAPLTPRVLDGLFSAGSG